MNSERGWSPDQKLDALYSFLHELYPANWQVRFGSAPHMARLAQQKDVDEFVVNNGMFESVAGHTWTLAITADLIRDLFPGLRSALDWSVVRKLVLYHDVREVSQGDFSAFRQLSSTNGNKENETKEWQRLTSILPQDVGNALFQLCESFEENVGEQTLEMRFVRFIDDLQAGNCVLKFGNDLSKYSEIANRISQKRVVLWAKKLADDLSNKGNLIAAEEVNFIMLYHARRFREAGINLELAGF